VRGAQFDCMKLRPCMVRRQAGTVSRRRKIEVSPPPDSGDRANNGKGLSATTNSPRSSAIGRGSRRSETETRCADCPSVNQWPLHNNYGGRCRPGQQDDKIKRPCDAGRRASMTFDCTKSSERSTRCVQVQTLGDPRVQPRRGD
jgi:hypothetical protein